MKSIAVADIGGTHARFALAAIEGGRVASLSEPLTLRTSEYPSFELAWEEFGRGLGKQLPDELAIAFAGPVEGELLKLTNSSWVIRPRLIKSELGLKGHMIVNDFGAVAHAVAMLGQEHFRHLCGPDRPLPGTGVISILGPGTGLGVAALLCSATGVEVVETEGGHVGFAPLDRLEDEILALLRTEFGRVSAERVASGPGLSNLYRALGRIEGQSLQFEDGGQLWEAALAGSDSLARAALDRLCLILGAVAGDFALAQGAAAVVIGGGVGTRISDHLLQSGFHDRFIAKGRLQRHMSELPVKLITYPQPGLYGAAAAYAKEHG